MNAIIRLLLAPYGRIKSMCWIVVGLMLPGSLLAQTNTFHSQFTGATGSVQFAYAPDSCTSVNGDLFVAASGSNGKAPTKDAPLVSATLVTRNTCTNTLTIAIGSTNTFQFTAQGGNGTEPPRTLAASGQVPLTDLDTGSQADVLTFTLTMNRVGDISHELDGTLRETYPKSTSINERFATTESPASAALSVSTTNLGPIQPTVYSSTVGNYKAHILDITR